MDCSTPGFPVHHQLPELTQTHIQRVSDAIQPSHPLSSPLLPRPKQKLNGIQLLWVYKVYTRTYIRPLPAASVPHMSQFIHIQCHNFLSNFRHTPLPHHHQSGFPGGLVHKESACNAGDWLQYSRPGFNPWVRKIPWRRKWLPTPVFLPEKFHGQRSLVGYSPWGHKELDMT